MGQSPIDTTPNNIIRAFVFACFLVAGASALCCEDDQQECVDWITSTSSCQPLEASPSPNDPNVMCPFHCPPECNEQELVCPGGEDQNGCQHPEMCVSATIPGLNGAECPNECPTEMQCAPEEQACDGGHDDAGCPLPKVCMPRSVPSTVDPEVECWLGCDPQCGEDMELCDMGMNEQGCPNPKECHHTKNNGWDAVAHTQVECAFECPVPCAPDTASHSVDRTMSSATEELMRTAAPGPWNAGMPSTVTGTRPRWQWPSAGSAAPWCAHPRR